MNSFKKWLLEKDAKLSINELFAEFVGLVSSGNIEIEEGIQAESVLVRVLE